MGSTGSTAAWRSARKPASADGIGIANDSVRAGRGTTRNVSSVSTPNVPNAPHISFGTSKPVTFLITVPPALIASPDPLTNRQPMT